MSYNGWKNRQTWNVALWIQNDHGLCICAVEFMNKYQGQQPYADFVRAYGLQQTLDGVQYDDSRLDHDELNAMMHELIGG